MERYLKNEFTNTTNQPFVILQYYFSATVWVDDAIFVSNYKESA